MTPTENDASANDETGTAKPAAKTGTVKTDATETGAAKTGAAKTGSKKSGTGNSEAETDKTQLDISQDVLYGIAQLATEGVAGLTSASPPAGMGELLTGRRAKGIAITRDDDALKIDLHVRVRYGLEIPKVAAEVQRAVREAVASMTGMTVLSVDVTVDAIDLPEPLTEAERG